MYAQLLGFLLFACQIILNGSSATHEKRDSVFVIQPATLPDGYVAFSQDQTAYKIHKESTTWGRARERCTSEGADLAVTDTVDKIAHVQSLKNRWGFQWLHVGIYLSNDTNQWIRVDNGFPLTSVPWASFNHQSANEGCAGIALSENRLVDYNCDSTREYFVCEIPMLGN